MSFGGPAPSRGSLSILIASRNTRDLLRGCLASIRTAGAGTVAEVIVVDNGSTDGSPEMVASAFPEVELVRNSRNVGFAGANNRALAMATGRHILLLNSDTVLLPDTLEPMVHYLDAHPDVGVVGCRLERPDGELDRACKRSLPTPGNSLFRFLGLDRLFPKSRVFGNYNLTWLEPGGTFEVDAVVGAFMMVRREVVDGVGGLDERFFMFGEDLDWCLRIRNARWKVVYFGERRAIHVKGASAALEPVRMNWHFHRSMVLFHRKHLVNRYPFFVNWLVYLGIGCRFVARSARIALFPGRGPRRPAEAPRTPPAGAGAGAAEET